MKNKSKMEQIFVLMLLFTVCSVILCATGCGGSKSCEKPQCGSSPIPGTAIYGVSVPGCGGIFSSGQGCGFDTCGLWSQSIKGVIGKGEEKRFIDSAEKSEKIYGVGCDNQYYKNEGCGGCARSDNLKSCYGVVMVENPTNWFVALGKSPGSELAGGCGLGCVACGFEAPGRKALDTFEYVTGVE